jgi:chorismate synthase
VFDKLEALLGHAILSVGAVRGVEIGSGFDASRMRGSTYNDEPYMDGGRMRTRTNNAGGIAGGISNGMDIVIRAAMRPPASISRPQKTVDSAGEAVTVEIAGRHDPCIVPRAVPVIEAMTALVLADCLLVQDAYSPR